MIGKLRMQSNSTNCSFIISTLVLCVSQRWNKYWTSRPTLWLEGRKHESSHLSAMNFYLKVMGLNIKFANTKKKGQIPLITRH